MIKVLVTGAAGFIGSHVAERLLLRGYETIGIDSLTDYYSPDLKKLNRQELEKSGIVFLPLDLAVDNLEKATVDVDFVIHLAAQPGISARVDFWTYERNNVTATQRLLEALEGTDRLSGFINIATSSIYGADATGPETAEPQPTSYYGVTKLAAEQLVLARSRDRGFPACSLRLFSVYGPRERPDKLYPRLIGAALHNRLFPLYEGSLNHVRSYTYVDDIVDGILLALDRFDRCRGEIFNIGTDVTHTTREGILLVEEIVGRPVQLEIKPPRPGDQSRTSANIDKARQVLGYNPKTTLADGLRLQTEWYRNHPLDYARVS